MSTKNFRLGLVGKKVGMTSIFDQDGVRVGVTVIEIPSNVVLQHRTAEKDGYTAVQVGIGHRRPKLVTKPEAGHFQKAGLEPEQFPRHVREIRIDAAVTEKLAVGQEIPLSLFEPGDVIDVTATSKGKGFQGVMKRHHFAGFPASHGTHEYFRHSGSIGCRTSPGRVHKGKRMSGQMGNARVTVQNLLVVRVIPEQRLLLVRGPVPGANGAVVFVRGAIKRPAKDLAGLEAASA